MYSQDRRVVVTGLGAITPIGGTLFLIGWAVLVWSAGTIDQDLRKARP